MTMLGKKTLGLVAAVLLVALGTPADAAMTGYWPLDEGSGVVASNLAFGGVDGVIVNETAGGLGTGGAAWITTDPGRGTVLSFNGDNGSGAYVNAGTIPLNEINGDFTWAFWANLQSTGTGGNDVVIGDRFNGPSGRWAKFTRSNFEWQASPGGGNVNIADIPFDGNWEHHAIVKSGTNFQYFLDGVPGASATFTGTFSGPMPFYIGGDANGERAAGMLSDVATFDQALTQTEIQTIRGGDFSEFLVPPPPTVDVVLLNDPFPSGGVDPAKWNIINKGLESTVDAGYDAPTTTGDVLTLGGSTTHSYWAGKTLQSVDSFSTAEETSFVVDRVSLTGTGTARRSSIWLWSDDDHFLHFSQNAGENGWQYNWNDVGGLGGTPAGSAVNIPGLDSLDADLGEHEMMLKYLPGDTPGSATVQMFLDGDLYAQQAFTNWTPSDFQALITGQARAGGDTVSAVFDDATVFVTRQGVPEPSTLVLAVLGLLGLAIMGWRRK